MLVGALFPSAASEGRVWDGRRDGAVVKQDQGGGGEVRQDQGGGEVKHRGGCDVAVAH